MHDLPVPCYHPVQAFKSVERNELSGKFVIRFHEPVGARLKFEPIKLPCGQCVGCRLEYSRQWAVRCVHEASLHEDNCFITLTYADEHLPAARSLQYRDFQLFMKRLGKLARAQRGRGVRFYMCGEYGENFGRPHYHALLFDWRFDDQVLLRRSEQATLWRSPTLERLWTKGHSSIGSVTFESAAYVARYVMKKVTGNAAGDHYAVEDDPDGVCERTPEFTNMSLKPGIGAEWYRKYGSDVYPEDEVVMAGRKMKPPRYYDQLFAESHPETMDEIKARRVERANQRIADNTPERLRVREEVAKARLRQKRRGLK